MKSVFLTGGSGFLGSRLLKGLLRHGYAVTALDRSASIPASEARIVRADLTQPELYGSALSSNNIVVHVAASTGRAAAKEHFRVNAHGTELLLDQCRKAGVRNILFVSTIAAKFPKREGYPYAQSKFQAEQAVKQSSLEHTIVRPTIILGPGSPILSALTKLATLPLIPVFGTGKTRVQPVFVDDLVSLLFEIIEQRRFSGETLELGGPTVLTIEELLLRIRGARRGQASTQAAPTIHIPLSLLLSPLKAAEAIGMGPFLPLTAGQLYSFRYDGTIAPSEFSRSHESALCGIDESLRRSLSA